MPGSLSGCFSCGPGLSNLQRKNSTIFSSIIIRYSKMWRLLLMRSGFKAGVSLFFIIIWTALATAASPLLSFASVPEIPAVPSQYVVDLAGIVDDATKAQLNSSLRELEEKTTAQMVVLTIPGLNGESLE